MLIEKYVNSKVELQRICFFENRNIKELELYKLLEENIPKIIKDKYLYSNSKFSTHTHIRYHKDKLNEIEMNIQLFTKKSFLNILSCKYNIQKNEIEYKTLFSNSLQGNIIFNEKETNFIEINENLNELKKVISKNLNEFIQIIENKIKDLNEFENELNNILLKNFNNEFLLEVKNELNKKIEKDLKNYNEITIYSSADYEFNKEINNEEIENRYEKFLTLMVVLRKDISNRSLLSIDLNELTIPLYNFKISMHHKKIVETEQLIIKDMKMIKKNSVKKWLNKDLKELLLNKIDIERLFQE